MATTIRPELSERNRYWINRHRYYELKHFCLQYPNWRKAYRSFDGLSGIPKGITASKPNGEYGDPTAMCAAAREKYVKLMDMVEQTAIETDGDLCKYILLAVTEGISYDGLKMRFNIPCNKDAYYELYRRFFWLLSQARK